ncbi:hypothetical protein ACJIZ3_009769 [Penstemon smallii]|uniref:Cystatin domain-containing protein n=1 Tax=Penstemon smallii TaxID=265156 RepID=A0ABD3TF87_9LAMI
MAKRLPITILIPLFFFFFFVMASAIGGRRVGGRTPIKNVESNKEVQDLGKYCIGEYNRRLRGNDGKLLVFSRVVEAEKQVVSGIKYYLKISAAVHGGGGNTFDAVVLVKSWLHSKELLGFAPAPHLVLILE